MKTKLILGDCLDEMKKLPNGYIDMVLADPPYGTTACKWDSIIPLEPMWEQLKRIIKSNGAIVMTATQPFTSFLVMSNLKMFKYTWVYQKTTPTGHLNSKKMPMRAHEDIIVFYNKLPVYNPIKTSGHKRKVSSAESRGISIERAKGKDKVYNDEISEKTPNYDSTERYPLSVQIFSTDKQKSTLHPTQKPIALMEYLIKTYTNKDDIVLDFCFGSGTTGIACVNTKRKFIGIEMDEHYFKIAKKRIKASKQ